MRPLNTSRHSFLTLLRASHSSRLAYPCFLLSSRLPGLPLISSFNRAPREISHASTRTARSLARSRLRHARLAVAVVVARPRPPVHDVYDLWLPHSGESGCFCERMRIYHDNRTPPDWVPLCGTTAARILRARLTLNRGRLSLEIRPVVICNPSAVQI